MIVSEAIERGSKFCFFLPSFSGGGAEKTIVFLASAIARKGYPVDLVVSDSKGPWGGQVAPQVNVIDLKAGRLTYAVLPLSRYLRAAAPTAVLSALTHANLCLLAAVRIARFNGRVLVSERNSLDHVRASAGVKSALKLSLIRRMYPKSDGVICVSDALSEQVRDMLGSSCTNVRTVYNPIDRQRIAALASCAPPGDLAGPRSAIIVAVGRLSAQKDFPTLIRAFAMSERRKQAHLYILGEGPDRESLEKLAGELGVRDRVHLPGFVDNVYSILSRASLFVLSSRYEGMPNALLEALACGCRVVSTRCPTGPEEILSGYPDVGALVPVGDATAMAAAIDAAIDHAEVVNADEVLRRFEPDTVIASYLAALLGAPDGSQIQEGTV